jgi:DNA-binding ferritin-like protein
MAKTYTLVLDNIPSYIDAQKVFIRNNVPEEGFFYDNYEELYDNLLFSIDSTITRYMYDGFALGGDYSIYEAPNKGYFEFIVETETLEAELVLEKTWSKNNTSFFTGVKKDRKLSQTLKKQFGNYAILSTLGNGKKLFPEFDFDCRIVEVEILKESSNTKKVKESFDSIISLSELADLLYCTYNDVRHIHFHVVGNQFKIVHELAEDYYEELSDNYDAVVEKASELKQSVTNPSFACNTIQYNPISAETIQADSGLIILSTLLEEVINNLCKVKELYNGKLDSFLDEIIDYWKKEVYYKLSKTIEGM